MQLMSCLASPWWHSHQTCTLVLCAEGVQGRHLMTSLQSFPWTLPYHCFVSWNNTSCYYINLTIQLTFKESIRCLGLRINWCAVNSRATKWEKHLQSCPCSCVPLMLPPPPHTRQQAFTVTPTPPHSTQRQTLCELSTCLHWTHHEQPRISYEI